MSLVLSYPGGQLKTITIAATAGNVTTAKTPGAFKRWVILYGTLFLDTDANPGNRRFNLRIEDPTNVLSYLGAMDTPVVGNETGAVDFGIISDVSNWIGGRPAVDSASFFSVKNAIIEGADELVIDVTNGLAGDSYSGFFRVLELGLSP